MKFFKTKFKLYRREKVNLFLRNRFINFINDQDFEGENIDYLPTHFSDQLKEKQKLKIIYGVSENSFKRYYYKSKKMFGNLSENLLRILELRLDNIVYRMGIGVTRFDSKQLISHNFISINNRPCNISSTILKIGDLVSLNFSSFKKFKIINCFNLFFNNSSFFPWIFIDFNRISCYIKRYPYSFELDISVNENLVLDFYSR